MKINKELPNKISVFPLSNFIIFPETTVPLNIFEPRYIEMINDSMKTEKMIGIIQPRKTAKNSIPDLYNIGCLGKITSFNETDDGRYMVILNGLSRFKVLKELNNNKLYREFEISFDEFKDDTSSFKDNRESSDLKPIFENFKSLFQKKGYLINWKELEKQDLYQTINTLTMASPFSLEEKQALLETKTLNSRKNKLQEILRTYSADNFNNNTIQ
jgi:Lon protease-like protein|tara:strand:- start:117 stop:761 length:645 start_codon:yes stop_codon:yes gene_type:complete